MAMNHAGERNAPPILSNQPGSFSWGVLHQRHPALTDQIRHAHPYSPAQLRAPDALLVDDSPAMWKHLAADFAGIVCLVADNAGRELIPDLVLIDHLLETGLAQQVDLQLKPQPYYVSDATTADLLACLRCLAASS